MTGIGIYWASVNKAVEVHANGLPISVGRLPWTVPIPPPSKVFAEAQKLATHIVEMGEASIPERRRYLNRLLLQMAARHNNLESAPGLASAYKQACLWLKFLVVLAVEDDAC